MTELGAVLITWQWRARRRSRLPSEKLVVGNVQPSFVADGSVFERFIFYDSESDTPVELSIFVLDCESHVILLNHNA